MILTQMFTYISIFIISFNISILIRFYFTNQTTLALILLHFPGWSSMVDTPGGDPPVEAPQVGPLLPEWDINNHPTVISSAYVIVTKYQQQKKCHMFFHTNHV